MPFIISPVTSFMTSTLLVNAGEEVKIVSDYGNVVIVEHNGNRFSVRKDNLTNEKREGETIPVLDQKNTLPRSKVKENKPELF